MPPKKLLTSKEVMRSTKKKNARTELDTSEPLTDLPKSKKPQKSYQAKVKVTKNSEPNLETSSRLLENSVPNLETSSRTTLNQSEYLQSENVEEQTNIDEDQQVQNRSSFATNKYQHKVLSQVNLRTAEKQVYINDDQQVQNRSSFAANKYQHKVPSQVKLRTAVSSIQTNEFDVEPLIQRSNSYSEHLSNHEDENESSDELP
ncbi:hypothetical protein C2G38_2245068 [Gigaspora rosea]|uniref:Uncharacterized protein n=1 Tax=Gigaspora rosea TaxID=44941 RepID=A0A397VF72_9GLOM|nr:hypothetical protein C2G38_2245068 [Gigaspora rosea]